MEQHRKGVGKSSNITYGKKQVQNFNHKTKEDHITDFQRELTLTLNRQEAFGRRRSSTKTLIILKEIKRHFISRIEQYQ